MAIPKRELQLSQDLMELQARYNRLNIENNRLTTLVKTLTDLTACLESKLSKSEDTVSILKSLEKKSMSSVAKKYAPKAK